MEQQTERTGTDLPREAPKATGITPPGDQNGSRQYATRRRRFTKRYCQPMAERMLRATASVQIRHGVPLMYFMYLLYLRSCAEKSVGLLDVVNEHFLEDQLVAPGYRIRRRELL